MNNDNFKNKLKEEFSRTTPDILDKIKSDSRFEVPAKEEKSRIFDFFKLRSVRYSLVSTFMIVIVAALLFTGSTSTQVYASTVTLDINPQLQFTLDEDDTVIEVEALNDDGDEIFINNVKYKKMTITEVIEHIVDRLERNGYIVDNEDNVVMIYVDGTSDAVKERVLNKVQTNMNASIQARNKAVKFIKSNDYDITVAEAKVILELSEDYKINPGRLILIQQIRKIDDSYTIRQLGRLTMRELYNLEKDLKDAEDNTRPYNDNNGNGNKNT